MKTYKTIEELLATKKAQKYLDENLSHYYSEDEVYAVLEVRYGGNYYMFDDLVNAVDDVEKQNVMIYPSLDAYHDSCDDLLDFGGASDTVSRYFDYDAYHNDCDYDITEASNGIVIGNW